MTLTFRILKAFITKSAKFFGHLLFVQFRSSISLNKLWIPT